MIFTTRIDMTAPLELEVVCAKIGKAFDYDSGGDKTFYKVYPSGHTEDKPLPATHLATGFWAIPTFAESLPYFMDDPELLLQSCNRDYSNRWPDEEPLTLQECKEFTEKAQLTIQE